MSFQVGVTVPAVFECDLQEGIERSAAAGADAIEFFDWESADPEAVRATAAANDVAVGGTLATGAGSNLGDRDEPAISDPEDHDQAVEDIERSIAATDRFGGDTLVVTVGPRIDTLSRAAQHNAVVRVLRAVAPTAERHDVTVVIEPLNTRVSHPGYFLQRSDRGFEIVEAVDSPNVKLLFDIFHQQVTEGNVTQNLTEGIDHVGHVHIADVPGRHEPGTGELNYQNVFAAIAETGYDAVVSCEFTPDGDPDTAVADVVRMAETVRSSPVSAAPDAEVDEMPGNDDGDSDSS
jgi:hydroxypyruvate isomerase